MMPKSHVLLEEIVSSVDDALAAVEGGAERFELCSALSLGGLTPSLATLAGIKTRIQLPVMFMLRPRQGGMAYTELEFQTVLADAAMALEKGADGLVFGLLTASGDVDTKRCRKLLDLTAQLAPRPIEKVFHRAFDIVADPVRALEQLIDLGVDRILTSGRAPTARLGMERIRQYLDQAGERIQILPGGGIDEGNVAELVGATGTSQVHVFLTRMREDRSPLNNPVIHFGEDQDEVRYPVVDPRRVRKVREILDHL